MAYDEYFADRIRRTLDEKHVPFEELKMMGGLCFKVNDKMLCGILADKKNGESLLMARIGEEGYESELEKDGCSPMTFTGRSMKGYLFISPVGFDSEDDLSYWIDRCLEFNPKAKASKKKTKKKISK